MTRKISALTQLGQIMNRAVENNDVKTFAPPPDWLEKSWQSAKRHGLDKLTIKEVDAAIAASRRERRDRKVKSERGR